MHQIGEVFKNILGSFNSFLQYSWNKDLSLLDLVKQDTLLNSPIQQFVNISVYMMPNGPQQAANEDQPLPPHIELAPEAPEGQAPAAPVNQEAVEQLPAVAQAVALVPAPIAPPNNLAAYNQIRNLLPPALVASLALLGIVGIYQHGVHGLAVLVASKSVAALQGLANFTLEGLQITVRFVKGAWKIIFKPLEKMVRSQRWVNALEGLQKIATATGKTAVAVKEMFKSLLEAAKEAMAFFGFTGLLAHCGNAAINGGNNNQPPQPPPQPPAAAV